MLKTPPADRKRKKAHKGDDYSAPTYTTGTSDVLADVSETLWNIMKDNSRQLDDATKKSSC
jgi:hypothetical protein